MKRYKLKRDTPAFKAGTECYIEEAGNMVPCRGISYTIVHKDQLEKNPNILAEWFEEIKPTRWKPEMSHDYYYISGDGAVFDDSWDDSNLMKVDVYLNNSIKHYTMSGDNGYLQFIDEEPHYFSQVPANVLVMPNEESIFNCIVSMQDAVNEIVSSEIDDFSAFCDAYLVLTNLDADEEDIKKMKENRVLVLPNDGSAEWLVKQNVSDQSENILKRLHDSIYRIASCPDFSSESFVGGVSSGIAIQYRLTGMETRAAKICANMKKALLRRIEIISGVASLKTGEDIIKDIEITFKRNIPVDNNSTISMISSLQGIVSNKTLLGQLDFINDVNKELEQVKEEKQANIEAYGLNAFTSYEEDEEDE